MTPTCTCSPSILDPLCPVEDHRLVQRAGGKMTPAEVDQFAKTIGLIGGTVGNAIRMVEGMIGETPASLLSSVQRVTAMGHISAGAMVASTPFGVKEVKPRQAIDAETVTLPTDGSEVTATCTTSTPARRGLIEPSHGSLAHVIRTRQPDQVSVSTRFIAEYPDGSMVPLLPGEPEAFDGQPFGDILNHPLEQMQRNGGKLPVPVIRMEAGPGDFARDVAQAVAGEPSPDDEGARE